MIWANDVDESKNKCKNAIYVRKYFLIMQNFSFDLVFMMNISAFATFWLSDSEDRRKYAILGKECFGPNHLMKLTWNKTTWKKTCKSFELLKFFKTKCRHNAPKLLLIRPFQLFLSSLRSRRPHWLSAICSCLFLGERVLNLINSNQPVGMVVAFFLSKCAKLLNVAQLKQAGCQKPACCSAVCLVTYWSILSWAELQCRC